MSGVKQLEKWGFIQLAWIFFFVLPSYYLQLLYNFQPYLHHVDDGFYLFFHHKKKNSFFVCSKFHDFGYVCMFSNNKRKKKINELKTERKMQYISQWGIKLHTKVNTFTDSRKYWAPQTNVIYDDDEKSGVLFTYECIP